MGTSLVTTFQAAKVLGVSPDTILRWIKSGKIPARRTLGGHYRIEKRIVDGLLEETEPPESVAAATPSNKAIPYCWEFHSKHGRSVDVCQDCLVFRTRAKCCYEMNPVPKEFGYLKMFCETECEDCDYYKFIEKELFKGHRVPS
jgi:excisionase family DNA binding protein